jgi:DNA segregation ATPase FtsK/SpoIIIE, S-DNA-T family
MVTRARAGGRRPTRSRKKKSGGRHFYAKLEFLGLLIIAATIAALAWVIDVSAVASGIRDGILGALGLGVLLIAMTLMLSGFLVMRRHHHQRATFVRRLTGLVLAALWAWGALGLNHAEWTVGGVDFAERTLGGDAGSFLVRGTLMKLAWLSVGAGASWLLAPGPTRLLVARTRSWIAEAWRRRWPHRAVGAVAALFRLALHRPGHEAEAPEVIIGATTYVAAPAAQRSMDEPPVSFHPVIDAESPLSPLGAGAAATFDPVVGAEGEAQDEQSASVLDDELGDSSLDKGQPHADEEPEQLGLDLRDPNGWHLPPMEILAEPSGSVDRKHDNDARARLLVDTLASFGVDASVVEVNEGPTVTQFGVEPGWDVRYREVHIKDETGRTILGQNGRPQTERLETSRTRVRVNKITKLQNDLALALAAPSLRIEAPVPGRAIVGIEVPNDTASVVTLRNVMETEEYEDGVRKSKLTVALGKGVSGKPVVADLGRMPHLLIAGATGSGKSVCINAMVTCLMMNATPDDLRFVMVDPKRVELTGYGEIPHLAFSEVIVDMDKVVGTLQAVVSEMEARYRKFADMGVRNIQGYNRSPKVLKKLPYWCVIIDELADLMMVAPFEVEKLVCRLAQLARATGIHLIIATQRPSVDVVTGLIKANFPTRIAFAVTSVVDSRTILDMGGAEKLLGRGDMLYMPTEAGKPTRIQGVYVSDAEVERLVEFWNADRFAAISPETSDDLLEEALRERNGGEDDIGVDEDDPALEQARELTQHHSRVSPSMLQRRLKIGYAKAERIIEVLAEEGIVGPREEGESRRVIVEAATSEVR